MSTINCCTKFKDNQQSNLDLERTKALKMGGKHLGNKPEDDV